MEIKAILVGKKRKKEAVIVRRVCFSYYKLNNLRMKKIHPWVVNGYYISCYSCIEVTV